MRSVRDSPKTIVDRKLSKCYLKEAQVWILPISAQSSGREADMGGPYEKLAEC